MEISMNLAKFRWRFIAILSGKGLIHQWLQEISSENEGELSNGRIFPPSYGIGDEGFTTRISVL